jgi:transposase
MPAFKTYRRYEPFQELMLSPNLQDWLPEGHLARFISDVVDPMDLSAIFATYEKGVGRGQPPYHPAMMTKLLIYGYCTGIRSSRAIERATYDRVPFRMLSGDQHPDHDSLADFRKRHFEAFKHLFAQTVQVAREAGLADLAHVAVDGSKIKANASKHKAMSYDRMQAAEKELEADIARILAEAEAVDGEEDAKFGKGRRGDELPKELQRREDRLKKIREAKQRLEERARAEAAERAREAEQKMAERRASEAQTGRKAPGREPSAPNPDEARPDPKAQCNFTDSDSRIMKDGATKEFTQAYNAQNAVDGKVGIIVGTHVTQAANDAAQLAPTVSEVTVNCGAAPKVVSADAGYGSEAAKNDDRLRGIDLYVSTGRERKSTDAAVRRNAANSARVASLLMVLCICCAGAAAGVGQAISQAPLVPMALAMRLQLSLRRRVALLRARQALEFAIKVTLSAVGSLIGSAGPIPSIDLRTARGHMRDKLQTETGKTTYARRKATWAGGTASTCLPPRGWRLRLAASKRCKA